MSKRIEVLPLPDGVNQRGSWQVVVSGKQHSTHTKKTAAKTEARRVASPGDVIEIRRTDGSVQSSTTYQGSSSGTDVGTATGAWDVDAIQDEYDDMTDIF